MTAKKYDAKTKVRGETSIVTHTFTTVIKSLGNTQRKWLTASSATLSPSTRFVSTATTIQLIFFLFAQLLMHDGNIWTISVDYLNRIAIHHFGGK